MPELPEVEVVRRGLEKVLSGDLTVTKIQFNRKNLRDPIPIKKLEGLVGSKVQGVERRAKYLIIKTSHGAILSHLGMTGAWRVVAAVSWLKKKLKHDHIGIFLSSGEVLVFNDPRRFGIFEDLEIEKLAQNPRLKILGPEPFSEDFSAQYLKEKLKLKNIAIKVAIMDQKLVVGVGNIYASEVLFKIGISPKKKSSKINFGQCQTLVEQIKSTLSQAIEKGGSSISNFVRVDGSSGSYQQGHQVYDRSGMLCLNDCGGKIKSEVLGGRSTFWCPRCQK